MKNTTFLRRIYCAFLNTYPFSKSSNPDINADESYFRDGSYRQFFLEKLNDFSNYKPARFPFFQVFASLCSIVSLVFAFIAYFYPPATDLEIKRIVLPLIIVNVGLFFLYSITILLIWNDKKNYSNYYETIINENIHIKDKTIRQLIQISDHFKSIIGIDIHLLAEKFRDLDYFSGIDKINQNQGHSNVKKALSEYLDRITIITSKLFNEYKEDIGEAYIEKYAACIKIIAEDDIFSNIGIEKMRFKTYSRSSLPNDQRYDRRLKTISKKYDSEYELIKENDDFLTLIKERRWYYYLHDFSTEIKSEKYKTSHPEGYQFYDSSITFPIIYRYDGKTGIILGYLCFDNFTKSAFPTCSEKPNPHEYHKVWEEFCCSQLDLLSIIISRIVGFNEIKSINPELVLDSKLRKLDYSKKLLN